MDVADAAAGEVEEGKEVRGRGAGGRDVLGLG
jgi:hypothetical protein